MIRWRACLGFAVTVTSALTRAERHRLRIVTALHCGLLDIGREAGNLGTNLRHSHW